jgi:hypothetical protein
VIIISNTIMIGIELVIDLLHWPAPMTNDWKADKSLNWLDTWREIENVYRKHPEKIKAIGMHSSISA